jgi:hypothetical protein
MENLRNNQAEWTPAEHAVHGALQEVEKMGASLLLTAAGHLLLKAKDAIAKHILGKEVESIDGLLVEAPTVGRIVHYYPGAGETLPNGMSFAPAIIVQKSESHLNLIIFLAEPITDKPNSLSKWSIQHQSVVLAGVGYWVWPPRN